MNPRLLHLGLAAVAAMALAACPSSSVEPYVCETDTQCGTGRRCVQEFHYCAESNAECISGWSFVDAGTYDRACVPVGDPEPPDAPPAPPFARDVCLVGPAMSLGRDACVDTVCAADATCCTLGWSELCVARAARTCAPLAGSASRCPMDIAVGGWSTVNTLRFRPDPASPRAVHCQPELSGGPELGFTSGSAWADADGDGDVDLALAALGGLRVFEGHGVTAAHTLDLSAPVVEVKDPTPHVDTAYLWGSRVAWGDFEHDGDLDLLWYDERLGLRLLRRDASTAETYITTELIAATEIGTPTRAIAMAWMQFDDDADLEIVATLGGRFVFFDRQPEGGGWARREGPTGADGGFAATFDRLVMQSGQVYFAGTFALSAGPTLAIAGARSVRWADVDGNGHLDVVSGHYDGVRLAPGVSGGFEPVRRISTAADADVWGVAVGDIDGDGRADIVGASHVKPLMVLLGRAAGNFEEPPQTLRPDTVDAQPVALSGVEPISTGLCVQP